MENATINIIIMGNDMLIKELKKQIADLPDDLEVYFRRVAPICGNLEIAGVAKLSEVSFFGKSYPCLIIEPTDDIVSILES